MTEIPKLVVLLKDCESTTTLLEIKKNIQKISKLSYFCPISVIFLYIAIWIFILYIFVVYSFILFYCHLELITLSPCHLYSKCWTEEAILQVCEPEPRDTRRESLFASPERLPPKNPIKDHNALTWYLLHAQCFHYAEQTGKILDGKWSDKHFSMKPGQPRGIRL